MNAYTLPTSLEINGVDYPIRSDFRAILDILIAANDPDASPEEQQEIMFRIIYPGWEAIPASAYHEACQKAVEFIDYAVTDKRPKPRTMDWQQDAPLIIPAVNKVAGKEIRAMEYLHWWTFLGYFMEIDEGIFSQVLAIRQKKARRKKLEKWEKEFERNNSELVKLKNTESQEQRREKDALLKWL